MNKFPNSVDFVCEMFEIKNVFYVVGTKGVSTLNNEVYKFSSNKEYGWCETCRVGNNILFIRKERNCDWEIRLFNPINCKWCDIDIGTKRLNFAVVYYSNKIFIVGGIHEGQTLNSIEIYDPVSKTQQVSPIKMNEARSSHKVIVYKKKLFVFGGDGKDGVLNSVEMFSPETNKFVMMAPMKIARRYFGCCRVGNLVYVVGGDIGGYEATKSVEVFNMDRNTWTDGVDLPVAEWNLYACVVNNKL